MITEDYVSFEIAELLREKGFNDDGYASIRVFANNSYEVNGEWINPTKDTVIPTLQMAMKWLREKGFIISPIPDFRFSKLLYTNIIVNMNRDPLRLASELYDTYEEACEGGIKYCLENLI